MTAYDIGLQDAFHIVQLASLAVFILIMQSQRQAVFRYVFSGILFLSVLWGVTYLRVVGVLDQWLMKESIWSSFYVLYSFLAAGLLIFGLNQCRTWWRIRYKREIVSAAVTLEKASYVQKFLRVCSWAGISVLAAALLGLASSIGTQDYAVFILMLDQHSKGLAVSDRDVVTQYYLGSHILFLVVWGCLSLMVFPYVRKIQEDNQPLLILISAAFFIAVAIGLIVQVVI